MCLDQFFRELFRSPAISAPGQVSINRAKIHWLIRLRTVATVTQVLALIPGARLGLIDTYSILPYLLVVGALTVFNGITLFWLQRRRFEPQHGTVFAQLAVDLTGLTVLLNLSGGWQNPFISLYFLHAGLGALLLQRAVNVAFFALVVGGMAVTFFLTDAWSRSIWATSLPGTTILLAEVFIAFLIWILTSWLAMTLRRLNHNVQVLREQNARFDRLRAVGAIAAGFSHRLATPLNTVKMRLERMARQGAASPMQHDVQIALDNTARCEDILRTYFAGRLEPDLLALEPVDMVAFVERVCKGWWLDKSAVDLRCEAPRGMQLYCEISPVEFSRSLIDLLDNAYEAQEPQAVEIRVSIRPAGHAVEICLEDQGPGFPAEVMARLGEPFVTAKAHGAGLGLFTAFALTHSLSGEFAVHNKTTGGGQVVLRLPLTRMEHLHGAPIQEHLDC